MSQETRADIFAELDAPLRGRLARCRALLKQARRVVVAFSGGVDSTFLLALAVDTLGPENVLAVVGVSPSLARRELEDARRLAGRIGAELVEIRTCELDDANYAANPADRCFFCKKELFGRLKELAAERGFEAVASGANADDKGDFRPGLTAGQQLGVINPLMQAGLSKDDIRAASRVMGLPTWNKPACACLASRIPYGDAITPERLSRIEQAEYVLRDLGFAACRVRDHGPIARVEVPAEQIPRLAELRQRIVGPLKALGFAYVALDLEGFRSGSMNETLRTGPESR